MIFNSFWKKIFILNIVLLIVIYRIFNVIEKLLKQNSSYNSLFPVLSEDGYPFFNSINCDIPYLLSIIKQVINNVNITNNFFPNNLMISKVCSFINEYILCKDNKDCLDKINKNKFGKYLNLNFIEKNVIYLYHSEVNDFKINNTFGISSLIYLINNKNEFIDSNNNKNRIEISFYNKIISGYYSFLNIKQYDNNKKNNIHNNDYYNYNLLKQMTQYEDKINDFFYLHSLILYSYIKIKKNYLYENSTESEDLNIILNYANQCIQLSDEQFLLVKNKIIPNNLNIFHNIFMKEIMDLIECIPDIYERKSFIIDLIAFNTMIKILSEEKNIFNYEYNCLKFFLVELSKTINDIFNAEIELRNKINLLKQNHIYIIIIYGCLSLAFIFFINRHLIKNKNKYDGKNKRKELIKQLKYKDLKNNNNKKLTQEELDYIQKLAKENKGDFLITK